MEDVVRESQQVSEEEQQTPAYFKNKSSFLYKLRCVWLFLLGSVVAIIGLLCVIYRKDMGANSFIVMMIGLFFTAVGSIYGKRKLRGEEAIVKIGAEPLSNQFLNQIHEFGIPLRKLINYFGQQATYKKSEETIPESQKALMEKPITQPVRPMPVKPMAKSLQPPQQKVYEKKEKPIVKIFICPNCGAENEMTDKFCFNCGFNLEKVKIKAKAKRRKRLKTEIKKKETKREEMPIKTSIKKKPLKKERKQIKEGKMKLSVETGE
jgi:hypothetical protein